VVDAAPGEDDLGVVADGDGFVGQTLGFESSSADSWFARAAILPMVKSDRPC